MIIIKRLFIITTSIIIILLITMITIHVKNDRAINTPTSKTNIETNNNDEQMEESAEEDTEETESVIATEAPVRDFLSNNVRQAVQRFFQRDLSVVSIGDSLTEGVGDDDMDGGYTGVLENSINENEQLVTIDNLGKRGNRTDQLIERLEEEVEVISGVKKADIILITIGANDIMKVFKDNFTNLKLEKFTSEQIRYEQRLNKILATIEKINPDASTYLIGFYNPFREYFPEIEELEYIVNSWNDIGLDVTTQFENTHYIPMKDIFEDSDVELFADDNFHPNHVGYELMAKRILNYLMDEEEDDGRLQTNE